MTSGPYANQKVSPAAMPSMFWSDLIGVQSATAPEPDRQFLRKGLRKG